MPAASVPALHRRLRVANWPCEKTFDNERRLDRISVWFAAHGRDELAALEARSGHEHSKNGRAAWRDTAADGIAADGDLDQFAEYCHHWAGLESDAWLAGDR
jgi:hypothetical protein